MEISTVLENGVSIIFQHNHLNSNSFRAVRVNSEETGSRVQVLHQIDDVNEVLMANYNEESGAFIILVKRKMVEENVLRDIITLTHCAPNDDSYESWHAHEISINVEGQFLWDTEKREAREKEDMKDLERFYNDFLNGESYSSSKAVCLTNIIRLNGSHSVNRACHMLLDKKIAEEEQKEQNQDKDPAEDLLGNWNELV